MTPALHYAARSDIGLLREGNEDSLYAGPRLLAVADGMGGHAAGEVASSVAIASLATLDEDTPRGDVLQALRRAVEEANIHLRAMVAGDAALEGMGTTLTAALWAEGQLGLVHVGDSRAYLLRDGELSQITHDHTLVQALVDEGRITAEEAGYHPQRSLLLRTLDGRDVDLDLSVRDVQVGDRYLLCTDGLSGVVSESTIRDCLLLPGPQDAVDRLVELALRGGGPDNVSCIVADVVDGARAGNEPVVVAGAVADAGPAGAPSAETAAGRAALATRRRRRGKHPITNQAEPPAAPRRRRRRALLPLLLVLVLAAAAGSAALYVRSQYYVGAAGDEVAIYRGLAGSVAGVHLSAVRQRLGMHVSDLPPYQQLRVRQGITAGSLADARRISAKLQDGLATGCPTLSTTIPTPAAPTSAPAASPSPSSVPLSCPGESQ